jgi:hypothetical protein
MLSRISRLHTARTRMMAVTQLPKFNFSDAVASTEQAPQERSIEEHQRVVGADVAFNDQKHGYVLSFPWNFEQIISDFEQGFRPMSTTGYWHQWMQRSRSEVDFNTLFRKFHQACAIPDHEGLKLICEPRLASYVSESLKRIHFHGLDVEMANLTIEQPSIRILKAEIN